MATVKINVDWVGHNFGAAPQDDAIACVATGKTLEEVEHNIVEAIRFHLEGMQAHGESLPVGFQDGWQPEFILTTRAQLRYTENSPPRHKKKNYRWNPGNQPASCGSLLVKSEKDRNRTINRQTARYYPPCGDL